MTGRLDRAAGFILPPPRLDYGTGVAGD